MKSLISSEPMSLILGGKEVNAIASSTLTTSATTLATNQAVIEGFTRPEGFLYEKVSGRLFKNGGALQYNYSFVPDVTSFVPQPYYTFTPLTGTYTYSGSVANTSTIYRATGVVINYSSVLPFNLKITSYASTSCFFITTIYCKEGVNASVAVPVNGFIQFARPTYPSIQVEVTENAEITRITTYIVKESLLHTGTNNADLKLGIFSANLDDMTGTIPNEFNSILSLENGAFQRLFQVFALPLVKNIIGIKVYRPTNQLNNAIHGDGLYIKLGTLPAYFGGLKSQFVSPPATGVLNQTLMIDKDFTYKIISNDVATDYPSEGMLLNDVANVLFSGWTSNSIPTQEVVFMEVLYT